MDRLIDIVTSELIRMGVGADSAWDLRDLTMHDAESATLTIQLRRAFSYTNADGRHYKAATFRIDVAVTDATISAY